MDTLTNLCWFQYICDHCKLSSKSHEQKNSETSAGLFIFWAVRRCFTQAFGSSGGRHLQGIGRDGGPRSQRTPRHGKSLYNPYIGGIYGL